jgi:hypothetical protein
MPFMRAKFRVQTVNKFEGGESLTFYPVCKHSYDETGLDEDNTFAKFSPSGELKLTVVNPALLGVIEPGQKFYLDFTLAA